MMKTAKAALPLILASLLTMNTGCNQNAQKVQDLEKEKADLTAKAARAEEELMAAEDRAAVAESTVGNLQGQLATAQAAAESASTAIAAAEAKAAAAEKALSDLQASYDKMVADAKTASDTAAAELAKLQKQVTDLTAALQAAKSLQGGSLPSNP